MKTANEKLPGAQAFLNIEDIAGNLIWTADKHLIGFLSLAGSDNSLLREDEHKSLVARMETALREETEPWQLLSVPRTADTQRMLDNLSAMRDSAVSSARIGLLDGEIQSLLELSEGSREPMILMKIWAKAALGADKELRRRMEELAERLRSNQISAQIMEDDQINFLCRVYSDFNSFHEAVLEMEDVTVLSGQPRRWRERRDAEELKKAALLDSLAPVGGFFFEQNKLRIGSAVMRCYAVTRYPSQVSYGWAEALTAATDAVTCFTYYPGQAADLGNALSKGARRAARDAGMESDLRQRKAYERQVQGADELLDAMDAQGGAVGHISIVSMVIGADEASLEDSCQQTVTRYAGRRMGLKVLSNLQQAAYKHLSPYYPAQEQIGEITRHIIPLETLVGGYPATVSTVRDDGGVYFAQTMAGGIISLDLLKRTPDRTNGNGLVTGLTGIGKSTVVKHIVQSMYMRGAKVIVFDPEREFKAMCHALGGSWWDAGGGSSKCNPLQVRLLPLQDEEDENGQPIPPEKRLSPMAQHMQTLYVILQYKLPGLTQTQLALLKRVLRLVYAEFGITMDRKEFPEDPKAYPIFSDIYDWLLRHDGEDPEYKTLALMLEDMAIGAEAQLWNGYTDIDLNNDLVVIDTNNLVNAPQPTRAAQYYNLLLMAFNAASRDKTTPYLIVADEAHILFDPTVPEAGSIVKQIAKRIRKYEGCFWMATQSLSDMLHSAVSLYGQAVVDNPAYKILMGCDGKNLAETAELFNLTAAEKALLESRQRGTALCLIGARHIKAKFVFSPYRLKLMGSGGGR